MISARKHYEHLQDNLDVFFNTGSNKFDYNLYVKRYIKTDCPSCEYDPVRKESTDIACPTCGGKGMLVTTKQARVPALFNDAPDIGHVDVGGVVDLHTLSATITYKVYNLYKNYLKIRNRVYIDEDMEYEIERIEEHGFSSPGFITLFLRKIEEGTGDVL
jgi:predicted RNA-binding Zn-ribbon protein involved in translation (DUF1610 family)